MEMRGISGERLLHDKAVRFLLVACVCLLAFFVNNDTLTPDIMESRNIITAREMVYDGNWIVPSMNGDLRLEKPPLPTWLTALSEIILPDSIALQRAMAGLAALLLVFYFWKFAARVLRTDPLLPTLLLCTCYNVILMGRTASWDIYCHAFMMGGIYHFARGCMARRCDWPQFVASGLFTGLSIMSKGPVSPFALFLPFLISYFIFMQPRMRGKRMGVCVMVVIAIIVGAWWYAYVHLAESEALSHVIGKESGSWMNRNVRPWYYYWKFFLETGVWSLLMLTSIFLPLFSRRRRRSRRWLMPLGWMLCSLILLSLMPEKKTRYLLPLLMPACYVMGMMLAWWKAEFRRLGAKRSGRHGRLVKADVVCFRVNCALLAVAAAGLAVAVWPAAVTKDLIPVWCGVLFSIIAACMTIALVRATAKLRPVSMLLAVTALFAAAECFVMPAMAGIVNNPEMKSISQTRRMPELKGLPMYHLDSEDLRIELVYAAHRKIRPVSVDSLESLAPCALLTHERAGDALPDSLWQRLDTTYCGRFDDNRRPEGNRRYSPTFIYHLTILRPAEEPDAAGIPDENN